MKRSGMKNLKVFKWPDVPVAEVAISRPEKMNALTVAMRRQFGVIFRDLAQDQEIRVVVVRGEGGEAFCSGGDIAEFLELSPGELDDWGKEMHEVESFPGPVIAAVDGYCFGAGMELALACDFRIATARSSFALPESRLGMMPGSGGTIRALRAMGTTKAFEMILTGRRLKADEALNMHLITEVVAAETLDERVTELACELATRSPLAMRVLKSVLLRGLDASLEAGCELERKAYTFLAGSEDYAEGVNSFLEKRTPRYVGK